MIMTIISGKLPCPPPQSAPNGPPADGEPGACVAPEPDGAGADGGGAADGGAAEGGAADGGAACNRSVDITVAPLRSWGGRVPRGALSVN